jgi:hypothetical protein
MPWWPWHRRICRRLRSSFSTCNRNGRLLCALVLGLLWLTEVLLAVFMLYFHACNISNEPVLYQLAAEAVCPGGWVVAGGQCNHCNTIAPKQLTGLQAFLTCTSSQHCSFNHLHIRHLQHPIYTDGAHQPQESVGGVSLFCWQSVLHFNFKFVTQLLLHCELDTLSYNTISRLSTRCQTECCMAPGSGMSRLRG